MVNSSRTGNNTDEMRYLNTLVRRYMPTQKPIAVDSKPSMHSLHDMITSTAASGHPVIRLPKEFYDPKTRNIVDHIAFEEEYIAYQQNAEMRQVGIRALLGDIVERMVLQTEQSSTIESNSRLFLAGSHDCTLAAAMTAVSTVDMVTRGKWPPYGSVLTIELFGEQEDIFINKSVSSSLQPVACTHSSQLSDEQKACLSQYYIQIRYGNQSLVVPGCREPGRNWNGDEGFCTLVGSG